MGGYLPTSHLVVVSFKLTGTEHLADAPRCEFEDLGRFVNGVGIAWFHAEYRTSARGPHAHRGGCQAPPSLLQGRGPQECFCRLGGEIRGIRLYPAPRKIQPVCIPAHPDCRLFGYEGIHMPRYGFHEDLKLFVCGLKEDSPKVEGCFCGSPSVIGVVTIGVALRVVERREDGDNVRICARGLPRERSSKGGHACPVSRSV